MSALKKEHYTKSFIYFFILILISITSLVYLFVFNPPKDIKDNVYQNKRKINFKYNHIRLIENSKKIGVDYFNLDPKSDLAAESLSPSLSAIDINNDGFLDLYITTLKGKNNLLFINHGGKYFTEEAKKYNLAVLNTTADPSIASWGDFNLDGKLEMLLARRGCHGLYEQNSSGVFQDVSYRLNNYCSQPNGVNIANFSNEGYYDIVFANFIASQDESLSMSDGNDIWMINSRYDDSTGGKNTLLKNIKGHFYISNEIDFLNRAYTHNAGVIDVNDDQYPDIFFANDYSYDQLFINSQEGHAFDLTTNYYIPKKEHGLSGMNTEVFDYNLDGLHDIYVSNVYKPPFTRAASILWKKTSSGKFINSAKEVGVDKCGFAWGAKFADIDNDNEPDLFVMNGRSRSSEITKVGQGKSMWYERVEASQIPLFLKKYYKPTDTLQGRYISAFERKCFFVQKNGIFYDLAPELGLDDRDERRSLLTWDFDNDGKMDYASAGTRTKVSIYHNQTKVEEKNHWIGFDFTNHFKNKINHGLTIKFNLNNGKKIIRTIYPANGYRGFSDARVHVGLGSAKINGNISVYWPLSRQEQQIKKYTIDQYNIVHEEALK